MPSSKGGKCPPGVFCLTPGIMFVVGLVLAVVGFFSYRGWGQGQGQGLGATGATGAAAAPLSPQQIPFPQQPVSIQIAAAADGGGGDDRYTRAPKPERHWATEVELPTRAEIYGKLPRVPTRGLPETYQSMGVLKMDDGAVLPLYGRRTASRSDRFQYYTRTDTYNPVQLPLQYKRRDCQDDVGCDELFDGEAVTVAATNQKGVATIYRFDGPTYVPGIL
jgi:hypothetical protein